MVRVVMWRAVFLLAMGVAGLAAALTWLLRRLLAIMCDVTDRAELRWLIACSDRRLARRRRVNVADQIRPLPGVGHDGR